MTSIPSRYVVPAAAVVRVPRLIFNGHARVTAVVRTDDERAFDTWRGNALATYRRGAVKQFTYVDVVEFQKVTETEDAYGR